LLEHGEGDPSNQAGDKARRHGIRHPDQSIATAEMDIGFCGLGSGND
jgi:hypothetical protein